MGHVLSQWGHTLSRLGNEHDTMGEIKRRKSAAPAASATGGADAPSGLQVFRREGEYWTIVPLVPRSAVAIGLLLGESTRASTPALAVEKLIAIIKATTWRSRTRPFDRQQADWGAAQDQSHHPALGYHLNTCIRPGQCVRSDPGRRRVKYVSLRFFLIEKPRERSRTQPFRERHTGCVPLTEQESTHDAY